MCQAALLHTDGNVLQGGCDSDGLAGLQLWTLHGLCRGSLMTVTPTPTCPSLGGAEVN